MASPWKKTVQELPENHEWCIIRLSPNYGNIVRARFDVDPPPYKWQLDATDASGIPNWLVPTWKLDANPSGTVVPVNTSILPWHFTISDPPADVQYCIIRVPGFYGEPVGARFYKLSTGWVFAIKEDPDNLIPFYLVPRWRLE